MFFDLDTRQLLRTRPNPLPPAPQDGTELVNDQCFNQAHE